MKNNNNGHSSCNHRQYAKTWLKPNPLQLCMKFGRIIFYFADQGASFGRSNLEVDALCLLFEGPSGVENACQIPFVFALLIWKYAQA
jgi:hypothetical protein